MTKHRVLALAKLLYKNFDMAFSREWDDLPEHSRKHWLETAQELDEAFAKLYRGRVS